MRRFTVLPGVVFAALAALFLTLSPAQSKPNCVTSDEVAVVLDRKHGEVIRFRAIGIDGKSYEVYLTPDASRGSIVIFANGCAVGLYVTEDWSDVVGGNDT